MPKHSEIALLMAMLLTVGLCKVVFEDNFDRLDFSKWKHDITLGGGGNWEFELYENNRSTSFVKDGKLNIKPVLTEDKIGANAVRNGADYNVWGGEPADHCTMNNFYGCQRSSDGNHYINPVMSAKLTTVNSFSLRFGRVEVKAKLPKGDWLWPAIWMLPRHQEYGTWPASGEIDIMESRGNVNYAAGGVDTYSSTLHWGSDFSTNQYAKTHAQKKLASGTFADDFHTFGLYWDEKVLYTYLDDDSNRVLSVNHGDQSYWQRSEISGRENPWQYSSNKCAPFDTEFYLIINLAVGGTNGYFPEGVGSKPWSNNSSRSSSEFFDNKGQWFPSWGSQSTFQIDSVKIWDLSNGETGAPAENLKQE